ncbi:MAG: hypothetical protein KAR44_11855 [Candidatus Aegiribacteria sp.]|nr:hypothetical protein [Candidatus Aegiribacteria sp.]
MKYCLTIFIVLFAACGTTQHIQDDYLQYTGSTQVMAVGTRSETVVFEDFETGERFALVGDLARELVPQYGLPVVITVIPTEEGWSMDPDLQKLELIEYVMIGSEVGIYE